MKISRWCHLCVALVATAAVSASEVAERCASPEHRQFDFWIGSWSVHNPDGELIGHNEIRPAARGCALIEDWRGRGGGTGMSINTYDADRGAWTQRWVGDGATLWLVGGLDDGSMVLESSELRTTPRGAVHDRVSWTQLADGSVRQVWEVSTDGGTEWQRIFVGLYRKE